MSEDLERLGPYPMRIQVLRGSEAEALHYHARRRYDEQWSAHEALAGGVLAAPSHDLIQRGGKTIPDVVFQNVYLGSSSDFAPEDVERIDDAILRALRDPRLGNVIRQYFDHNISYEAATSLVLEEAKQLELDEPDVQAKVIALFEANLLDTTALDRTCFNLILPPGTRLRLDSSVSTRGLGGYHGSVEVFTQGLRRMLYYSANVYSQRTNDSQNGIVAFDAPWKNVVGTLYHELLEFQTDPDVGEAIRKQDNRFIGYNSNHGEEIGDQPISANTLDTVFGEVVTQPDSRRVPVQFMYSNAVHGAEGPIEAPH